MRGGAWLLLGCRQGRKGGPTWGAGAAQVQGVIQLAHGILQDALGLRSRAPDHCELLVQEPLLQPLLLRLLVGEAAYQDPDPAPAPAPGAEASSRVGQTAPEQKEPH